VSFDRVEVGLGYGFAWEPADDDHPALF